MKFKALLLGCALWLGALPGGGVLAGVACASSGATAGLVVDTGSEVMSLCVALPSTSVSGTKLIQLAGEQHGLQYRIQSGAVCQLAGTGPSEGDCFAEYPDYWGYWRGTGDGGWAWSSAGAGSTAVEAGDVEGWSWGSGDDGSSHRQPPQTRYESVCTSAPSEPKGDARAGEDRRSSDQKGNGDDAGEGREKDDPAALTEGAEENDDASVPVPENEAEPEPRSKSDRKRQKPASAGNGIDKEERPDGSAAAVSEPDESFEEAAPSLRAGAEGESPPVVGLAGLGAALLIAGAGAFVLRRRRTR